jgi:hypothetical protein
VTPWPDGKRFAFTVFDDTDRGTLDNLSPVYTLLSDLGFRTTKSVWPIAGRRTALIPGATCEEPGYRKWTLELQARGFEIGYHNATFHSSTRIETELALDRFREIYGAYPRTAANHAENAEAIYWGPDRLTGSLRHGYSLLRELRGAERFRGHVSGDIHFWGDLCKETIKYVRNFVFNDIDTLAACPIMPYHDPARPFVNYWFAASDGGSLGSYVSCLNEANQDRLEEASSACIVYTHFGKGFARDGVDRRFEQLMRRLARKNGWFVPVGELLDHLLAVHGRYEIGDAARTRLERQWLEDRFVRATLLRDHAQ